MEDILRPSQVATLLQVHVKTVYRLAENGAIPGKRIGRSWRFNKTDILDLATHKAADQLSVKPNGGTDGQIQRQMQSLAVLPEIVQAVTSTLDIRGVLDGMVIKPGERSFGTHGL
jgi:excisionase family DNA binding protein